MSSLSDSTILFVAGFEKRRS